MGRPIVVIDQKKNVYYTWNGGHGVHIHDRSSLKEVGFFNVGDFANESATPKEVHAGIERWQKFEAEGGNA